MGLHMEPLQEKHLADATVLVANRYRDLRSEVPSMPPYWEDPGAFLPLVQNLASRAPGVAAIQGGRLVGFLTGLLLPDFRGRPAALSLEWANGAEDGRSREVYQEMYAYLSARWVADGYRTHLAVLMANDREGMETWHWLGFGFEAADAMRDLSPVRSPISSGRSPVPPGCSPISSGRTPVPRAGDCPPEIEIRRASVEDLALVLELDGSLRQHMRAAPTFLPLREQARPEVEEQWLADPANAQFIAYQNTAAVGFMRFGPASQDASTIIRDEGTTSIVGAWVDDSLRGSGVGTAILDHGLTWARDLGYQRCGVDFEPQNTVAVRFWLREFQLVAMALGRTILPVTD